MSDQEGGGTSPLIQFLPFPSQGFRLPYEQPRDSDTAGLAWAPPIGPPEPLCPTLLCVAGSIRHRTGRALLQGDTQPPRQHCRNLMLQHLHDVTGKDLECVTRGALLGFCFSFIRSGKVKMSVLQWLLCPFASPGTWRSLLLSQATVCLSVCPAPDLSTFLLLPEEALLDVCLQTLLLKKPIATQHWNQMCFRKRLFLGWRQHLEWVINVKFSEPSESLKWPRNRGGRLWCLPQRSPIGNSLHSGSWQC